MVLVVCKAAAPHNHDGLGPVLIVQTAAIGDFVLTTPLVRALAKAFPDRGLVLAVSPRVASLAAGCPHASTIVMVSTDMSKRRMLHNLVSVFRSSRAIARLRPSIAVVARSGADLFFESAIACLPVRRHGSDSQNVRRNQAANGHFDEFFTATHAADRVQHESRLQLQLLDLLGVPPDGDVPEVWWGAEDELAVDGLVVAGGQYVALAPGASEAFRRWPPARFALVAQALVEDGWTPVIVGGPQDEDFARTVRDEIPTAIDACGRLELRETAAVLARCRLAICNDSGPAHLAAAVGIPLVIVSPHPIGAPRDHDNAPERFGPLGVTTTTLRPVGSADCQAGCHADIAHCISEISVADVLAAAAEALAPVAAPNAIIGPTSV